MLSTWFESVVGSEVLNAIFFVLPAMFANTTPMLFGGGLPMDFRKNWFDGKRILGNNKTMRGFFAGCAGGFVMGILTWWWFNNVVVDAGFSLSIANGFFQGMGAVVGDVVGSFIKRRLNIPSGGSLIIIDQTGFLFFGLLFGMIGVNPLYPWIYWIIMLPLAFCVHFAANAVSYTMGWKDVWW